VGHVRQSAKPILACHVSIGQSEKGLYAAKSLLGDSYCDRSKGCALRSAQGFLQRRLQLRN
jgi:hypothetical protein